jgi:hypothetical protein
MRELTKEYTLLFNGLTDLHKTVSAMEEKIRFLQQQAEELYISSGDESTSKNDEQIPAEV